MMQMENLREKIAQLYYRSNSVRFGDFELSVHRDRPELPKSPWYLHYPKDGEEGSELLPKLFDLIGAQFYEICEAQEQPIRPKKIAGLPKGALGLGDAWARHYSTYPKNLLKFEKIQHQNGTTEFEGPVGEFEYGDDLSPCEDHISAGRNNLLFLKHARNTGFAVTKLLVVVDRQQGGRENLKREGVDLISIFTADELLEFGQTSGYISRSQFDIVQEYRATNQFSL